MKMAIPMMLIAAVLGVVLLMMLRHRGSVLAHRVRYMLHPPRSNHANIGTPTRFRHVF